MTLTVLKSPFAICRLLPTDTVSSAILSSSWLSITKTDVELSIVSEEKLAPKDAKVDPDRRLSFGEVAEFV